MYSVTELAEYVFFCAEQVLEHGLNMTTESGNGCLQLANTLVK